MTTTRHHASIHIDAPVERVFDYIKDPAHFLAAMPTRKHETNDLLDVHLTPEGVGSTYTWSGREFGVKLTGVATRQEYVANERFVDRSSTGPVWTWTFEPDGTGTRVTLAYEYSTRVPLVDKVVDKLAWSGDEYLEAMLAMTREAVAV